MKRQKVAIDADISGRLARALQALYEYRGFEFVWVPDIVPPGTTDEHWASVFHRFGGKVVISADKNIAKRPHQLQAFQSIGLVCFFMQSPWSERPGNVKAAHLIYWWPSIEKQIQVSTPKDCWQVPFRFSTADFKKLGLPNSITDTESGEGAA